MRLPSQFCSTFEENQTAEGVRSALIAILTRVKETTIANIAN